jgi:hypothetical protein
LPRVKIQFANLMEYMLPRVKYIAMSFKFLNDVAPSTLLYANKIYLHCYMQIES